MPACITPGGGKRRFGGPLPERAAADVQYAPGRRRECQYPTDRPAAGVHRIGPRDDGGRLQGDEWDIGRVSEPRRGIVER